MEKLDLQTFRNLKQEVVNIIDKANELIEQ